MTLFHEKENEKVLKKEDFFRPPTYHRFFFHISIVLSFKVCELESNTKDLVLIRFKSLCGWRWGRIHIQIRKGLSCILNPPTTARA